MLNSKYDCVLAMNLREDFTIMEKAPTRPLSW